MRRALLAAVTGVVGVTAAYARVVKPWHERWGATDEEVALGLAGDETVADPAEQVTRAITIDATPADVWPWVVQLGADRGGFYSYDWLENLFGLQIHSSTEVVADWQELAVGDLVTAIRSGTGGWFVTEIEPDRVLVLQVADVGAGRPLRRDDPAGWEFTWTFALRPTGDGRTRLLVRERTAFGKLGIRLVMAPVGLVSFVMTRKMLMGIRDRAERSSSLDSPRGAPGRRRSSDRR